MIGILLTRCKLSVVIQHKQTLGGLMELVSSWDEIKRETWCFSLAVMMFTNWFLELYFKPSLSILLDLQKYHSL